MRARLRPGRPAASRKATVPTEPPAPPADVRAVKPPPLPSPPATPKPPDFGVCAKLTLGFLLFLGGILVLGGGCGWLGALAQADFASFRSPAENIITAINGAAYFLAAIGGLIVILLVAALQMLLRIRQAIWRLHHPPK